MPHHQCGWDTCTEEFDDTQAFTEHLMRHVDNAMPDAVADASTAVETDDSVVYVDRASFVSGLMNAG